VQTIEKLQLLLAANRSARSELVKRCAVETGAILSATNRCVPFSVPSFQAMRGKDLFSSPELNRCTYKVDFEGSVHFASDSHARWQY